MAFARFTAAGTIVSHRMVCILEGIARSYPVVRFTAADGREREVRAQQGFPPGSSRYPVGADVVVRYDPSDPERADIVGSSAQLRIFLCALAVLALLIAARLILHH